MTALERILFIPDTHAPYHDIRAWNLMMRAAKDFRPNHVIILGDFVDFYAVSDHTKDPVRATKLATELEVTKGLLKEVKSLKAENHVYVSGNHEDRLRRYLHTKAPELHATLSVAKLLTLKELGFKYVPYMDGYQLGKLHITHECGNAGADAHRKALNTYQTNILIGHTHRMALSVEGDAEGNRHVGAMLGWLGDSEQVDYMHKIKVKRDWTLGFGVGHLEPRSGFVHIIPTPIANYKCVVNGKLYVA